MGRWFVALSTALVFASAACSADETAPSPSPSSAFPSGPSATGSATGPGDAPTGTTGHPGPGGASGPGGAQGSLTEGTMELQLSGDVRLETTLRHLLTGVVAPSPAGFAVVWTGAGTDATTVGLGGGSFAGTEPTSPTLVLSITAQTGEGLFTWTSNAGECDVTLGSAERDRFAGSFACRDLAAVTGEVVAASGAFEATG